MELTLSRRIPSLWSYVSSLQVFDFVSFNFAKQLLAHVCWSRHHWYFHCLLCQGRQLMFANLRLQEGEEEGSADLWIALCSGGPACWFAENHVLWFTHYTSARSHTSKINSPLTQRENLYTDRLLKRLVLNWLSGHCSHMAQNTLLKKGCLNAHLELRKVALMT